MQHFALYKVIVRVHPAGQGFHSNHRASNTWNARPTFQHQTPTNIKYHLYKIMQFNTFLISKIGHLSLEFQKTIQPTRTRDYARRLRRSARVRLFARAARASEVGPTDRAAALLQISCNDGSYPRRQHTNATAAVAF